MTQNMGTTGVDEAEEHDQLDRQLRQLIRETTAPGGGSPVRLATALAELLQHDSEYMTAADFASRYGETADYGTNHLSHGLVDDLAKILRKWARSS